jgi:hypothetical protein
VRKALAIFVTAAALLGLALLWMPATPRVRAPAVPPEHAPAEPRAGTPGAPPAHAPEPESQAHPEPAQQQPAAADPDPAAAQQMPPHPSTPEYAALLAARFDADPPDVSVALERDIARNAARFMPAGSRLDSIECRQMLCRVRSLHPDKQTYEAFLHAATSKPELDQRLWHGQMWIAVPSEIANARVESVIYLQRDPIPAEP